MQRVATRLLVLRRELLSHLEGAGEMESRFFEGQQPERALAGGPRVPNGLVGVGERRAHGEVMGQLVDVRVQLVGVDLLRGDGDLVVIAHPPSAQELAVDGVADQRVGEGIAVACVVSDPAQQARVLGLVEGVQLLFRRQLGRLGHDSRLALGPRHRRRLQQIDDVLGQPRDPAGHQLADGFGRAEAGRYRCVTLFALLGLAIPHLAQELVEEERVAVGQPAQLGHEVRRGVRPTLHEFLDGFAAQSLQVDGRHGVHSPELRQHGAQSVCGWHLGVDEHADDAELTGFGAPQQVAKQEQGGLIGGVQVVDHEQDGPAHGQLVERCRHRLEEAEPIAVGFAALVLEHRRVLSQAQDQPGELGELPVRHARDPVRRQRLEVPPECLCEGLERGHRVLVAAAPQDQGPFRFDGTRQLRHQSGLADARVAVDEEEAPGALCPPTSTTRADAPDSRDRPTQRSFA